MTAPRCQPGDICRVIGGCIRENVHKLVTVIRLNSVHGADVWWDVEPLQPMLNVYGHVCPAGAVGQLADKYLQPLRGDPGDDETLAWAGRPPKVDTEPLYLEALARFQAVLTARAQSPNGDAA